MTAQEKAKLAGKEQTKDQGAPSAHKDIRTERRERECDGSSQCRCSDCRRCAEADARPRQYGSAE